MTPALSRVERMARYAAMLERVILAVPTPMRPDGKTMTAQDVIYALLTHMEFTPADVGVLKRVRSQVGKPPPQEEAP